MGICQFLTDNTAQDGFKFFLVHRLFKRFIYQRLIPALTGLGLEEGNHYRVEHNIDSLLAGGILKVDPEPVAVNISLCDDGGIIRDYTSLYILQDDFLMMLSVKNFTIMGSPRNPQSSDYNRCVEDHFETFVQIYEERFKRRYGFWRPYLQKVIYRYLDAACPVLDTGATCTTVLPV